MQFGINYEYFKVVRERTLPSARTRINLFLLWSDSSPANIPLSCQNIPKIFQEVDAIRSVIEKVGGICRNIAEFY